MWIRTAKGIEWVEQEPSVLFPRHTIPFYRIKEGEYAGLSVEEIADKVSDKLMDVIKRTNTMSKQETIKKAREWIESKGISNTCTGFKDPRNYILNLKHLLAEFAEEQKNEFLIALIQDYNYLLGMCEAPDIMKQQIASRIVMWNGELKDEEE